LARIDEPVDEQRHDRLDSAMAMWRNGKPWRARQRDAHRSVLSYSAFPGSAPSIVQN
jgi:hypothetical protein